MANFIPLSVPNFSGKEKEYVNDAVVSEWVSTGGSKVGGFEQAIADYVKMPRAVACNSGTSGLHLAMLCAGIGAGDEVIAAMCVQNRCSLAVMTPCALTRRR